MPTISMARLLICGFSFVATLSGSEPTAPAVSTKFTQPISLDVWDLKKDPDLVDVGAVVLEDHWRIGMEPRSLERTYRVRIVNEAGREAAQFFKVHGEFAELVGRVVYPDGTQLQIDQESDLVEKIEYGYQGWESKQKVLIPPGVTSDCVFELYFKLKTQVGFSYLREIIFGNWFDTKILKLDIGRETGYSVLFMPAQGRKHVSTKSDSGISITLSDVPGIVPQPLSAGGFSKVDRFFMFSPQKGLPQSIYPDLASWWAALAQDVFRPRYDFELPGLDSRQTPEWIRRDGEWVQEKPSALKGTRFRTLAEELSKELPVSPQARAIELWNRLAARIQRWSHLSREEQQALFLRKVAVAELDSRDLEEAIRLGGTHSRGWLVLFYHLLKEVGVKPHILQVVSIYQRPFIESMRTDAQFHWTLLRVVEDGKPPLLLDSDLRFAKPGLVSTAFQGTKAVAMDSATWGIGMTHVGFQQPEDAVSDYRFTLGSLEQGRFSYRVEAVFRGMADQNERNAFLRTASSQRWPMLQARLEGDGTARCLEQGEVGDPTNLGVPMSWQASGWMRGIGRGTLGIPPFPGLPWLVGTPDSFPVGRDIPFYLGPPRTQKAVCQLAVPAGYRIRPMGSLVHDSAVGRVSWSLASRPGGREVEIRLDVIVKQGLIPADQKDLCRSFLACLDQAMQQHVFLEPIP